jgi:hypothetical protein
MLAVKNFQNNRDMLDFIQGSSVARGSAGTNTAASPNLQDLTAGAFTSVLVGDQLVISGETAIFTVDTKTDDNNLILSANIVGAHAVGVTAATWQALRGGVGEAALKFGSPLQDTLGQSHWIVVYDALTFKV